MVELDLLTVRKGRCPEDSAARCAEFNNYIVATLPGFECNTVCR
jgi:hypothetical protein